MSTIVAGATCFWWDSIDKIHRLPNSGLPCCPHCKGTLIECAEDKWNESVALYNKTEPGYTELIAWMRGKCHPTQAAARAAYKEQLCP